MLQTNKTVAEMEETVNINRDFEGLAKVNNGDQKLRKFIYLKFYSLIRKKCKRFFDLWCCREGER